MYTWKSSQKLQDVSYEIRGRVLQEALQLEAQGCPILKLNIGNTAPFDVFASEKVIDYMKGQLSKLQGYSHSQGITEVRQAIVNYYGKQNINIHTDDVYVGNGASELIVMSMQALCNSGDEILIPAPDYPLWTAAVALSGGVPRHYVCDEQSDWQPDIKDIKSKINSKTKALVLINPNNPTGAVYTKEVLEQIIKLCVENNILIFSDEIYEKIVYDGIQNYLIGSLVDNFPCVFFSGLSKAFRLPGFRSGWMCICDPKKQLTEFRKGLDVLSSMRLCSNTPSQIIIQKCLEEDTSIYDMTSPGGALYERREATCRELALVPGVSFVKPKGALYMFPKVDIKKFNIHDDQQFVLDFLREQHVLIVHGTGFHWDTPDHFRIVMLPNPNDITQAIQKLKVFLENYQQQ